MSEMDLMKSLREMNFLRGFTDEHLDTIASASQLVEIAEGRVIFQEGDPATDIYLIIRGKVSLEICAPGIGCRRIHTVDQGELLGWSPVLEQPRLTVTARTLSQTKAVRISGSQILTLCQHDPSFGYEFMRRTAVALGKRLSAARMQMLDVYGPEPSTTEKK